MPTERYWMCPYVQGDLLTHRFPPEWGIDRKCQTDPAVAGYAKEVDPDYVITEDDRGVLSRPSFYYRRPDESFDRAWDTGVVLWAWECRGDTPEGPCGFMVGWKVPECHNPLCIGARETTAEKTSSGPDAQVKLHHAPPTPYDAVEDFEEAREAKKRAQAGKKRGTKHRALSGCPHDCPGPHAFTLITKAPVSYADRVEQVLSVEATVIPPVQDQSLSPWADAFNGDPSHGKSLGALAWQIVSGPGKFVDGDANTERTTRTSKGNQPTAKVEATAEGKVVVQVEFQFGSERFPTKEHLKQGHGSDTVELVFVKSQVEEEGRLERYLEIAIMAPMIGSADYVEREFGNAYLWGSDFRNLSDARINEWLALARKKKAEPRTPKDGKKTIQVQNALIDQSMQSAQGVLDFRERVRTTPERFQQYVDYVHGLEGKRGCWAQNAMPLVLDIVRYVLREDPQGEWTLSFRRVLGLAGALNLSTDERARFGYLASGAIPEQKAGKFDATKIHRNSTRDQIARMLSYPELDMARAVLYGSLDRFKIVLGEHETLIEQAFQHTADELLDFAEGEGYEGVVTPAHTAHAYMLQVSFEDKWSIYRAWFGRGKLPERDTLFKELWHGAFGFDRMKWSGTDPDKRARDELGGRRKRLTEKMNVSLKPPKSDLVGFAPHLLELKPVSKREDKWANQQFATEHFAQWAAAYK